MDIRKELEDVLRTIEAQWDAISDGYEPWVNLYEKRNADGKYILEDLIVARAHILSALARLPDPVDVLVANAKGLHMNAGHVWEYCSGNGVGAEDTNENCSRKAVFHLSHTIGREI